MIKTLLMLPVHFWRECWHNGIRRALIMASEKITGRRPAKILASDFPGIPSNSFAYLHLLKQQPLVSIVMPVYNPRWLKQAVDSALAQSYRKFELILDDCSSNPDSLKELAAYEGKEKVRIIRLSNNLGTSGATNAGIAAAKGGFVAFMDHDDLLHPDALALFVRTLNQGCNADVYYSDEILMYESGVFFAFLRKPRISLDLLLSCNAVLHFCIIKAETLARIGPLKSEYDGAQDHDLMLRAWEAGCVFEHMPYMSYIWRLNAGAQSEGIRSGLLEDESLHPKAYRNAKKALRDFLKRNSIAADVTDDAYPWYRVKYKLPPDPGEVAIIIPFKDKIEYLQRLLPSLEQTAYKRFVVVLVNNRSEEPETAAYLKTLESKDNIRIFDFDEPYNFSRLYNRISEQIPNELQLFMNNDIEAKNPDWLDAMLEHIHRPGVAAVGARLLRPDGSLQHASVIFKPSVFHCAMNLFIEEQFYTLAQRDVSGVTAACMLIRKSAFQAVGGFDEVHFPIGFSDADLCLKLKKAGYSIVYTPHACLLHHESATRKVQEESYELYTLFRRHIGDTQMFDRHYHSMFMG